MKASLAGRELHRRLHPHPRVTAVAKETPQPPRRLPSPATKRARDLQKGSSRDSHCIFASGLVIDFSRGTGPTMAHGRKRLVAPRPFACTPRLGRRPLALRQHPVELHAKIDQLAVEMVEAGLEFAHITLGRNIDEVENRLDVAVERLLVG